MGTGTADEFDACAEAVKNVSGQQMDWGYQGGRDAVFTTGNAGEAAFAVDKIRGLIDHTCQGGSVPPTFESGETLGPHDFPSIKRAPTTLDA